MRARFSRLGDLLRTNDAGQVTAFPTRFLLTASAALGATYGLFMGLFAVRTNGWEGLAQLASSIVKLPLLFLLTIAVTFPSLYVFNTLMGSKLSFEQTLRTVGAWIAVILAVAASLGPILGFFTVSTRSYPFIILLNVILLGLSGFVGCASLFRMLRKAETEAVEAAQPETSAPPSRPAEEPAENDPTMPGDPTHHSPQRRAVIGAPTPSPDPNRDIASQTLSLWVIIFGIIGLQMSWVLRPFIGSPDAPFALFRDTESNAFAAILRVIGQLAGVNG
jgi:hypothetical protein